MLRNYGMLGVQYEPRNNLELQFIEQNTGHDGRIVSQLQGPDAVTRYQDQLLRSTRPEKHVQEDYEDGEAQTLTKTRYRMNLFEHGNDLGDNNLAYKPEIVNDPISNKSWDERPDVMFEKEKRMHRKYLRPTLAQKDSIMRFPENEPRYRSSEGRNHIDLEVRAVGRVEMEKDREYPIYQKSAINKVQQNFRNQIVEKHNMDDPTQTRSGHKKVRPKAGPQHRTDLEVDVQDDTNVAEFYNIFEKHTKKNARLNQVLEPISDDTQVKNKDKKWVKKKTSYINPGSVSDSASYMDLIEKVNHIESKLKVKTNRPNLNFKTIAPNILPEQLSEFARKMIQPRRGTSHMPNSEFVEYGDDDRVDNPDVKDHYIKKKSNMVFKVCKETVPEDESGYSGKFKKQIQPNKAQFRDFGREILDDQDQVYEKYVLTTNGNKKGNLSFSQVGHNTQDTSKIGSTKKKKVQPKLANFIPGYDERPDEDCVQEVENHREKSTKTRVRRKLPVDSMSISADPYNETKKSLMHPSEIKKRNERNKNKAEYARTKNQEYL